MEGSASQAGFYYQNNVAALQIIDCLFFQSDIVEVMLENYNKGNHIDDIIISRSGHTDYFQIKWSDDEDKSYTVSNMLKSDNSDNSKKSTKKSLFKQLSEGYNSVKKHGGSFSIYLYTTKKAGTQKRGSEGIGHSLSEIINLYLTPLKSSGKRYDEVENFEEYRTTIEMIRIECALEKEPFDEFIKSLEFRFEQPSILEVQHALKFKMETLGLETVLLEKLLNSVVKWSISGLPISKATVLNELGISGRFEDKLSHYFKVISDEQYVRNNSFFSQLESALSDLSGGYIFIEGLPGIGKSTSLTKFRNSHKDVTLAYYCFIPDIKNNFGELRHQREYFLRSLCIAIEKEFSHVELPHYYSERYQEKFTHYIDKLSTLGERIIFIIDGLDHVHRDAAIGENSLLNAIKGNLPDNIFFVLSSQYSAVLSQSVLAQINSEPQRYIKVSPFNQHEIKEYLDRKGIDSIEILNTIEHISGGIPLYLHYISEQLIKSHKEEYAKILSTFPQLIGGTIDQYHEYLFQGISTNSFAKWVLAVLAYRKENTEIIEIKNILSLAGENKNLSDIEGIITMFSHLLKPVDGRSYSIFHNSFREFIISKTGNLKQTFNEALVSYYKENPFTDDAYRNYFSHLYDLGKYEEIISSTTLEWAKEAWRNYRTIEEINANIELAIKACIEIGALPEFIRIIFLKDQFMQVREKMDNSEIDLSLILLRAGEFANSLRSIWDGDFVLVSKEYLCFYLTEYYKKTNNLLPVNVISQGFSKPLRDGDFKNYITVFKAEALFQEDILEVFSRIEQMQWSPVIDNNINYNIEEHTTDENVELNNAIKFKVINYLAECKQYRKLLTLENSNLNKLLQQKVRLVLVKLFFACGEMQTAIQKLEEIDFGLVEDKEFISIVAFCTEYLGDKEIWKYFPLREIPEPILPDELIEREYYTSHLREEIVALYRVLKVLWIFQPETIEKLDSEIIYKSDPAAQIYESLLLLSRLWHQHRNDSIEDVLITEEEVRENFEECIDYLLGDKISDSETRSRGLFDIDTNSPAIARNIKVLFDQVFGLAINILSDDQIKLLVQYWMDNDDIDNSFEHHTIGLTIAEALHKSRLCSEKVLIHSLINHAESRALRETDSGTLTDNLGRLASIYGSCGFKEDFERIYNDILNVSFGLSYRKDYQAGNIVEPLGMLHEIDPDNTLKRLGQVFQVQYKLENAGNGRMRHIVLSNLIEFVGDKFPALTFRLMEFEEENVDRDEMLEIVLEPMIMNSSAEQLKYYFAITKTMGRWARSSSSNAHFTNLALALLKRAIFFKDKELIEEIVDLLKFNSLTEHDEPKRLEPIIKLFKDEGISMKEYGLDFLSDTLVPDALTEDRPVSNYMKRVEKLYGKLSPEELVDLLKSDYTSFIAYVEVLHDKLFKEYISQTLRREYSSIKKAFLKFLEDIEFPLLNIDVATEHKLKEQFILFKEKVINLASLSTVTLPKIKALFEALILAVETILQKDTFKSNFEKKLDINKWLGHLISEIQRDRTPDLQKVLSDSEIVGLADHCEFNYLEDFVGFIDKYTSGNVRAMCLLKVSSRFLRLDFNKAKEILSMLSDYEYESVLFSSRKGSDKSIFDIITDILKTDVVFGRRFLLYCYYTQHSKYSRELTRSIDKLLTYKEYFKGGSVNAYFEANLLYNKELGEGLPVKENKYEFLSSHVESLSFKEIVIEHLIWLFNYPVVKIRELSLHSCFDIIWQDSSNLRFFIKKCIVEGNYNEIEHGIVLLHGIALKNAKILSLYKDELLKLLEKGHFNIVQTGKELINLIHSILPGFLSEQDQNLIYVVENHIQNSDDILQNNKRRGQPFLFSKFQFNLLKKLDNNFYSGESIFDLVYDEIETKSQNARSEDASVQRRYNINTNFDTIEIQSPYYDELKSIINRVFSNKIRENYFDSRFVASVSNDFRLYDPSRLLYRVKRIENDTNWFTEGISKEDFLTFVDFDALVKNFVHKSDEFIPLVEIGSQRRDKYNELNGTCYFDVKAFLKTREFRLPDRYPFPYFFSKNVYAHEMPLIIPDLAPFPITQIKPLIQVAYNNFRGEENVVYACLFSDIFSSLSINKIDLLQIFRTADHPLRASEWIYSYDSGPSWRRYKPGSEGFTLKIDKKILLEYLQKNDLVLCYQIEMRRSTDTDRTENIMDWHKLTKTVEIEF